ncbi:hypothetical protein H0H92_015493 [Tricholoma furcatifolium]|nr:hypothetical protein H0H92_015493 [Tricholoma furcatifolium]
MFSKAVTPLVLYDIITAKGHECWSPNVWRVRLALNYKQIPYRTEWVEYPDIGKVGREIGAKPTTPVPDGSGTLLWTCPMILDPNHLDAEGKATAVSESSIIIKYLDDTYPEIKVIPDGTEAMQQAWFSLIVENVHSRIKFVAVPRCPDILSPRGREYFITTREKWWGPLDKMCPDRETAWKAVQEGLDNVAQALDANGGKENLRVVPGKPTYADFVLVAPLLWARSTVTEEEFETLKSWNDGRWGKIVEQSEPLLRVV